MDVTPSEIFGDTPHATFILVTPSIGTESVANRLSEYLDESPGVQAQVSFDELGADEASAYDTLLREAKVTSRWGKDLDAYYREFLEDVIDEVDSESVVDRLYDRFDDYRVDVVDSGVVGEAVNIGFDVSDRVSTTLEQWLSSDIEFTKSDLQAAVGYVADVRGFAERSVLGGVVITLTTSPSNLSSTTERVLLPALSQQLVLAGLNVAIVAPSTGSDEREQIESLFQSVGRFSVETIGETGIEVEDEIRAWVDEWYDRLCYDLSSSSVSESVNRRASVAAYDFPENPYAVHFERAITVGLQRAYSEKKLTGSVKERFDDLWDECVSPHENYYKYSSKRSSFPVVTVARTDGTSQRFALRYEGLRKELYLNGRQIFEPADPEEVLIEEILRYLDATRVSSSKWERTVQKVKATIPVGEQPEMLAQRALLCRGKLPPADAERRLDSSERGGSDKNWYVENWRPILSSHVVRSVTGTRLIHEKMALQDELAADSSTASDRALYYKLTKDIENAWDYFLAELKTEVESGLTNEYRLTVNEENGERRRMEFVASHEDGATESVMVSIGVPYYDVSVEGIPVSTATVSNTAEAVLNAFEFRPETATTVENKRIRATLLSLVDLYVEIEDLGEDDMLYFDDFVQFCATLPTVEQLFGSADATEAIREHLGDRELIAELRDAGGSFHRKGSDPYTGIKVPGDRYIAMELHGSLVVDQRDDDT